MAKIWSVNPASTGYTIASGTAQLYTATFNPRTLVICNDAAAGGAAIYVDFTGVTAAAHAITAATAIRINPQESYSVVFNDPNVSNTFTIAIMTASSTADFRFIGTRP